MVKETKVRKGVVAELEGKYWGIQYKDGKCTEYGFGPLASAHVSNQDHCLSPTDMTYKGSPYLALLRKASLRNITITTVYEVEEGKALPHA